VIATVALAVIEAIPDCTNEPNAVTVPVAVILAEASAREPPVADTVAVPNIAPLPNCVLVPIADTSANPFIDAVPNTNAPLVVTVIVAVAVILAADVLNRVADAVTNASAVIAADASTVLPANELKGAWEKLAMPNIYCSLFVCWFWNSTLV
jgi:PHD/YefM family antitoxin component YafN of YafNO toxin-antitoxin module